MQFAEGLTLELNGHGHIIKRVFSVLKQRQFLAGFRQRQSRRPAVGSETMTVAIHDHDIIKVATGPAFVDHGLHRGIVTRSQRRGQGRYQHRAELLRLRLDLAGHRALQKTCAVGDQHGQH